MIDTIASASGRSRKAVLIAVSVLAMLATIPYLPFIGLPHISDDYVQIELARQWGPISAWPSLGADPLYRCRSTSLVLTYWTDLLFGPSSSMFQIQSIALHILATLAVAGLGWWHRIGWQLAFVSAAFFAIHEGHQEAVVWYAALPELLVFLFGVLAVHCWIQWCERPLGGGLAYGGALLFFALALLSKESGVAVVGLLAGICCWTRTPPRRALAGLTPFVLVSLVYAVLIFAAKTNHLHLNDGTFSLSAPAGMVIVRSIGRLLWVWGIPAVAILWWNRKRNGWLLVAAGFWMAVTILPYSFLTYMPRVPSRHVYWSSAGLAFLVGGAWLLLWNSPGTRWVARAAAVAMVVHNCGWLWAKKYPQYVRRAEPTEALVRYVRDAHGPLRLKCFPYSPEVAERAVRVRLGRSVETTWEPEAPAGADVYCDPYKP